MKKILLISKMTLKGATNPLAGIQNSKQSNMGLGTKIFIWVMAIIGIASILFLFGAFAYSIITQLEMLNQAYLAVYLYLTAISLLAIFFSLINTPAVYYFDEAMENFLVLPITRRDYLSAKWIANAYSTSLIILPFSILFTIIFAINASITWATIPFLLIATIVTPLIPISLVVVFIVLLFSFIPFVRNKNLFVYMTTFMGLVLGLGINFMTIPVVEGGDMLQALIDGFQGDGNTLLTFFNSVFPNVNMFVKALSESNVLYLIAGLVITFIVIYLTILFTQYKYLDSALSMSEVGQSKKIISSDSFTKQTKQRSHFKALMKQDLRNILRTPIFASNYFLPMIILPISFAFAGFGGDMDFSVFSELPYYLNDLLFFFEPMEIIVASFFLFTVLGYLMGSFSTITSTAISREGVQMQNYLQMPMQLKDVVYAKVALGTIVTGIFPLIVMIILQILFKAPIYILVIATLSTFIGVFCANVVSIFLDVIKPKLNWSNEQEAVKQNMLSVIPMFLSFGVVGLSVWIALSDMPVYLYVITPIVIIIVGITGFIYIGKKGIKHLTDAIQSI